MSEREMLALALFAKWEIDGSGFPERDWEEPDWEAYEAGKDLNSVELSKDSFLQEADWLLELIKPHRCSTITPALDIQAKSTLR